MTNLHTAAAAILLTTATACSVGIDGEGAVAEFDSALVEDDCGCTDEEAPNYNPAATDDDGSCEEYVNLYAVQITDESFAIEYSKNFDTCAHLKDENNNNLHIHNYFCESGSHVIISLDREDVDVELDQLVRLRHGNGLTPPSDFVSVAAGGCTEEGADNYDPDAIAYDGSCYVAGCTDPEAPNFNPDATLEDESCVPYVTLHAVLVNGDNFAIEYSKNFSTCVHLKDASYDSVTDGHNHFCESGSHVVVTLDADHPTTVEVGQLVRLHHGNGHTAPSDFVAVERGGCLDDDSCYLTGDVNEDGSINVADITKVVGFILGNVELSEAQQAAADMNNDGSVNVVDIVALRDVILGD